jgi:hypothetical protein
MTKVTRDITSWASREAIGLEYMGQVLVETYGYK